MPRQRHDEVTAGQIAGTQPAGVQPASREPASQLRERIVLGARVDLLEVLDHASAARPGAARGRPRPEPPPAARPASAPDPLSRVEAARPRTAGCTCRRGGIRSASGPRRGRGYAPGAAPAPKYRCRRRARRAGPVSRSISPDPVPISSSSPTLEGPSSSSSTLRSSSRGRPRRSPGWLRAQCRVAAPRAASTTLRGALAIALEQRALRFDHGQQHCRDHSR